MNFKIIYVGNRIKEVLKKSHPNRVRKSALSIKKLGKKKRYILTDVHRNNRTPIDLNTNKKFKKLQCGRYNNINKLMNVSVILSYM